MLNKARRRKYLWEFLLRRRNNPRVGVEDQAAARCRALVYRQDQRFARRHASLHFKAAQTLDHERPKNRQEYAHGRALAHVADPG
jgi:hypothetical protein